MTSVYVHLTQGDGSLFTRKEGVIEASHNQNRSFSNDFDHALTAVKKMKPGSHTPDDVLNAMGLQGWTFVCKPTVAVYM